MQDAPEYFKLVYVTNQTQWKSPADQPHERLVFPEEVLPRGNPLSVCAKSRTRTLSQRKLATRAGWIAWAEARTPFNRGQQSGALDRCEWIYKVHDGVYALQNVGVSTRSGSSSL